MGDSFKLIFSYTHHAGAALPLRGVIQGRAYSNYAHATTAAGDFILFEETSLNNLHRFYRAAALVGLALSLSTFGSLAQAHAKVESTTPAADSSVTSPKLIQVHFNEAVETKMSSIKLAASDGTAVPIMSMNDAKDPATLSIMPNAPLKAGLYKVMWSAVSDDGHKTQGTFSFTVQ
jgi:methionine-rich copper-binding protein CopC